MTLQHNYHTSQLSNEHIPKTLKFTLKLNNYGYSKSKYGDVLSWLSSPAKINTKACTHHDMQQHTRTYMCVPYLCDLK